MGTVETHDEPLTSRKLFDVVTASGRAIEVWLDHIRVQRGGTHVVLRNLGQVGRSNATRYRYEGPQVSFEFAVIHDGGDVGSFDDIQLSADALWAVDDDVWLSLGKAHLRDIALEIYDGIVAAWSVWPAEPIRWRRPDADFIYDQYPLVYTESEAQRRPKQARVIERIPQIVEILAGLP